jgi:D-3-phosphoglycerate dehydrogenase
LLKVAITDAEFPTFDQEERILAKAGAQLIVAQSRSEQELIAATRDADGLLVQYAAITARVIAALERCRVICSYGIGVDNVDLAAATAKGIVVANVPDYGVDEVSDHALLLLLAAARRLLLVASAVKDGSTSWDFTPARPIFRLRGKTLGLIGFGRISQALAKKARGLGLHVMAYDPFVDEDLASAMDVRLAALPELLSGADLISVHVPLTDETRNMIGEREFGLMKENVIFVNTSRGRVVDQAALRCVVEGRQIGGVGLDVLAAEPPTASDAEWIRSDLVTVTPHIAWYSEEALRDLQRKAGEAVATVLRGGRPASVVNPLVYERGPDS